MALLRADIVAHHNVELVLCGVEIVDIVAHVCVVQGFKCFRAYDENRVGELTLQHKESVWVFLVHFKVF